MQSMRTVGFAALVLAAMVRTAWSEDACASFHWDVSRERAVFATRPEALKPGTKPAGAPFVLTDHLYDWMLLPQQSVEFAVTPGRRQPADGARAGLARLKVSASGTYRISLDQGLWIDIVADSKAIPSKDFQDGPDCRAPHKIVEFDLPAAKELLIQLSGVATSQVRVAITRVPQS
jgi:hypothetical protein